MSHGVGPGGGGSEKYQVLFELPLTATELRGNVSKSTKIHSYVFMITVFDNIHLKGTMLLSTFMKILLQDI